MAEQNVPKDAVVDPAKNNAEIARKQAEQDISGKPTATGEFGEATAALDELAAQVKPKETPPEPKEAVPAAKEIPPAPKTTDAPPTEDERHRKRAEDIFKDAPTLPPNASPKSAEAFSTIKIRAAREISDREQKITALEKQLEESKNPTPERLQADRELEEHRQWRLKMDVDFDPKFKEFDKSISQQREFVYAQLAKSPAITPEVIAQIKKYGGPDMVKLDKLFESVKDPTLQRLVESKVADIEMAKYNKDQAIASAKGNLSKYLEDRQTSLAQSTTAGRQAAAVKLEELLGKLDWTADKTPAADADDAAKKEAGDHNKFVGELRQQVSAALQDDSPEMKAILITGMAQLFQLQRRVPGLEAQLAAATKELGEVRGKWEAVKSSSRSRLHESQAPAGGIPQAKKDVDYNQRAGDALDDIARQVMEKRSQAAAGQ